VARATTHGRTNIANTAQRAQTFSHFQRFMNRVGVAKLPLSMPAPSASVAAPEDAIRKTADGIIAVLGFRRETCIVPRAVPVNPREMQMDDLFIEIRRQISL